MKQRRRNFFRSDTPKKELEQRKEICQEPCTLRQQGKCQVKLRIKSKRIKEKEKRKR